LKKKKQIKSRRGGEGVSASKTKLSKTAVSESRKPEIFEISFEKPERVELESVLPYLEERIAFRVPSDVKYLDEVLDHVNERLLKFGIVNPGDSEVIIALDEAIVNAIKHGNKYDAQKRVEIVAEFSKEGVWFRVTDEGEGFARDLVPDPTSDCRLLEPNGRGLLLINHIMDEVCYNNCGNSLEMFKRKTASLPPGIEP
jgi:serine/threonine-protein kinase RsbW